MGGEVVGGWGMPASMRAVSGIDGAGDWWVGRGPLAGGLRARGGRKGVQVLGADRSYRADLWASQDGSGMAKGEHMRRQGEQSGDRFVVRTCPIRGAEMRLKSGCCGKRACATETQFPPSVAGWEGGSIGSDHPGNRMPGRCSRASKCPQSVEKSWTGRWVDARRRVRRSRRRRGLQRFVGDAGKGTRWAWQVVFSTPRACCGHPSLRRQGAMESRRDGRR